MAALAAAWTRDIPLPLGVLGGGLLLALSFWAIRGAVDALIAGRSERRNSSAKVNAVSS